MKILNFVKIQTYGKLEKFSKKKIWNKISEGNFGKGLGRAVKVPIIEQLLNNEIMGPLSETQKTVSETACLIRVIKKSSIFELFIIEFFRDFFELFKSLISTCFWQMALCTFLLKQKKFFNPKNVEKTVFLKINFYLYFGKNGLFQISFPKKFVSEFRKKHCPEKAFKTTIFRQTIVKNGGFKSFFIEHDHFRSFFYSQSECWFFNKADLSGTLILIKLKIGTKFSSHNLNWLK